jgi:hypothetical protein
MVQLRVYMHSAVDAAETGVKGYAWREETDGMA